jgi:hypothetical protein
MMRADRLPNYQSMPQEATGDLSSQDWFAVLTLPTERYSSFSAFIHLILFGGIAVLLNMFAQSSLTVTERILASTLVVAPVLPLELWLLGIDRTIPVLVFYSITYAGMYGVSTFLVDRLGVGIFSDPVGIPAMESALWLLVIGLACLFAGYYGPLPAYANSALPRFKLKWRNPSAVRLSLWAMTLVGLFFALPNLPGLPKAIAQLSSFGNDLFTIGICGLVTLQFTVGLNKFQSIQLWLIFVPLRIVVGLASGLTGVGLLPALSICLIYASVRHKIPWKTLGVGVLAFFILRPVEGAFRMDNSVEGIVGNLSIAEKTDHFVQLTETVIRFAALRPDLVMQVSAHRLALTPTFAEVVQDTPRIVPFWGGSTYYPLLFKLIPRFIYPDKPEEMTGGQFGHRYGIIDNSNINTSINLPQIVELYANFGTIGALVGMFLFGVTIKVALKIYLHPGMGFGGVIATLYIASKLIDFQSAFSMIFGALPWELLFIGILHVFVMTSQLQAESLLGTKLHANDV